MYDDHMKEVYFSVYCVSCAYYEEKESGEHCCDCLNVPARQETRRPIGWEQGPQRFADED